MWVNLQLETLGTEVVADFSQGRGGLLCQNSHRLLVAVDARAYKIVVAVVAHLYKDVGDGVGEEAEAGQIHCVYVISVVR